ncbi:hypothetical protein GCM10009693_12250 [Leucobacter chromiireducens subsp. chromiireducens]
MPLRFEKGDGLGGVERAPIGDGDLCHSGSSCVECDGGKTRLSKLRTPPDVHVHTDRPAVHVTCLVT